MWRERNFYRDVWKPTQEASGRDIRPHECRHSYVTQLRAAGVNDPDLAEVAGHRVETMLARYTHAVGESFGPIRAEIGKYNEAFNRTVDPKSRQAKVLRPAVGIGEKTCKSTSFVRQPGHNVFRISQSAVAFRGILLYLPSTGLMGSCPLSDRS
jgi:hypothetical protein